MLEAAPTGADAPPEVVRARALLALARGRGADAETALGAQVTTPPGQLIIGLRRWRERKPDLAIKQLRAAIAGDSARVLAHYLLGRALEDGGKQAEARAAYAKTLAANPQHAGALVGQARLHPAKPGEQRKAAEALVVKVGSVGSPTEVAEAQVLLGEAQLALGRSPEAVAVLTKAVAAYPQGATGQRALVEALLADGHSADALARLRAADPTMLISLEGRIAMGAALVANGQVAEGTAQLEAAAAQSGQNPRVPYWLGIAAESRRPPDPAAAAEHYRRALAFDPVFLPGSLRLAALLQKQGKPEDALRADQAGGEGRCPGRGAGAGLGPGADRGQEPDRGRSGVPPRGRPRPGAAGGAGGPGDGDGGAGQERPGRGRAGQGHHRAEGRGRPARAPGRSAVSPREEGRRPGPAGQRAEGGQQVRPAARTRWPSWRWSWDNTRARPRSWSR